jgi:hypothetical protein
VETVEVHPILAGVFARAGASDADRDLWLAERRGGVTATEVRDLYLKGPSFKRELLQRKLGRIGDVGDLSSIPVIGWGKLREPAIAAMLEGRYAIAPESRVFRAIDNPRFLASPDGTGLTWDEELVVSEIKTAGHDVSVGTQGYVDKGYEIQQQWVMRVIGARRSMFAWEERIEVAPDQFEPGALKCEWIDYNPELVAELEKIAMEFLAERDAMAADDYVEPDIDDALDTMAVNVLRFREEESSAAKAKKLEWNSMLERLEGCDALTQESALARVTYSPGETTEGETFDVEAAKAADPELFAEVQALSKRWNEHQANFKKLTSSTSKASLTVTAIKPKAVRK